MPTTSGDINLGTHEVREYFETGWIVRRALFGADEVARMRTCFDELERIAGGLKETALHRGAYFVLGNRSDRQIIQRVVWAGGCQHYLLEVGGDPRLTGPSAQLLDD